MLNLMMASALLLAAAVPVAAIEANKRIVVIRADKADDERLAQQKALLDDAGQLADRDMQVFAVLRDGSVQPIFGEAPMPAAARRLPGGSTPKDGFSVSLIGKDGGLKHSSATPITAEALFALIDAMPMRRQEQRTGG